MFLPNINRKQATEKVQFFAPAWWLAFKLVWARLLVKVLRPIPHVFHVKLVQIRSAVPEISYKTN